MDAGFIAAFKLHYRRLHLQNAVDRDERGDGNIYKVDQLTALKCSVAAWEKNLAATVANCFRHTGLFVSSHLLSVDDQDEHTVERELQDAINIIPLRNPMIIYNLINSLEKDKAAHMESNDSEII